MKFILTLACLSFIACNSPEKEPEWAMISPTPKPIEVPAPEQPTAENWSKPEGEKAKKELKKQAAPKKKKRAKK